MLAGFRGFRFNNGFKTGELLVDNNIQRPRARAIGTIGVTQMYIHFKTIHVVNGDRQLVADLYLRLGITGK